MSNSAKLTLPSTMKGWQYTTASPNLHSNLKMNPSIQLPKPASNQHLVQIFATALNPVDYKLPEISLVRRLFVSTPATPSLDFAGRIITPAAGSSLLPGEMVFGVSGSSPIVGGALREYNVASIQSVAKIPVGLDPLLAAGVGVAAWTAYQSIVPRLHKGERVLILGGSGGTGTLGIQIAKNIVGAHVTTSCSGRNEKLVRELGADEVVDYTKGDVLSQLLKNSKGRFDLVIDNVGTDEKLLWGAGDIMNPGATYVKVSSDLTLRSLWTGLKMKLLPGVFGGIRHKVQGFWPKPHVGELVEVAELIRDGTFKMVVEQTFAFEDAPKAFELLKTGRARGKIVVDVASKNFEKDTKST